MDQLAVEVALDAPAIDHNPDVVPLPGLHRAGHRHANDRFGPVHTLFNPMLRVAPAADVPPRPVIIVRPVEQNQKAFTASILPRLERDGVVAPTGLSSRR